MGTNIIEVLEKNKVSDATSLALMGEFTAFFDQAKEIEKTSLSIVVTDASQTDIIASAKEVRKRVSAIRIETEKRRKELKSESLKKGKAIDGVANLIKEMVAPSEEHLKLQEKFVENLENEKRAVIVRGRTVKLSPYVESVENYDLEYMPDEQFLLLLEGAKVAYQKKLDDEKMLAEAIENKRLESEAEQARISEENERLRAENEKLKGSKVVEPVRMQNVNYTNRDRVFDFVNELLKINVPIFENEANNISKSFTEARQSFLSSIEALAE